MSKIRAYITHPIRNKNTYTATKEEKNKNSERAVIFGKAIRIEFPTIDFYIPGEHIEIDNIAIDKNYLTDKQILDIDCTILSKCNFIVVFAPDDYISKGMKVEMDYAIKYNIPIISAVDGSYEEYCKRIVYAINCHLTSMIR